MKFSEDEIVLARRMHNRLPWEPMPGHFVYDETGFCKQPSPFQDRVYFILNYPYFMKTVGGVDRFKSIMTWLPTWHDTRVILRDLAVSDAEVASHLAAEGAIERGTERISLYNLIAARLKTEAVSATSAE